MRHTAGLKRAWRKQMCCWCSCGETVGCWVQITVLRPMLLQSGQAWFWRRC